MLGIGKGNVKEGGGNVAGGFVALSASVLDKSVKNCSAASADDRDRCWSPWWCEVVLQSLGLWQEGTGKHRWLAGLGDRSKTQAHPRLPLPNASWLLWEVIPWRMSSRQGSRAPQLSCRVRLSDCRSGLEWAPLATTGSLIAGSSSAQRVGTSQLSPAHGSA